MNKQMLHNLRTLDLSRTNGLCAPASWHAQAYTQAQ